VSSALRHWWLARAGQLRSPHDVSARQPQRREAPDHRRQARRPRVAVGISIRTGIQIVRRDARACRPDPGSAKRHKQRYESAGQFWKREYIRRREVEARQNNRVNAVRERRRGAPA
jgi:hypothetical protein